MRPSRNTNALQAVAGALGPLLAEVVFVGGATIGLYAAGPAAPESRYTEDVDCIIELASYGDFAEWEERLRGRGFRHDLESRVQIRWRWQEYTADVMPTDAKILGFSNPWYESGMRTAVDYQLPNGQKIRILNAPHVLATKFCALADRGEDLRYDSDCEDIIYLLSYRPQLPVEVGQSPAALRHYLATNCRELLSRANINEIIDAARDRNVRAETIRQALRQLAFLTGNKQ